MVEVVRCYELPVYFNPLLMLRLVLASSHIRFLVVVRTYVGQVGSVVGRNPSIV